VIGREFCRIALELRSISVWPAAAASSWCGQSSVLDGVVVVRVSTSINVVWPRRRQQLAGAQLRPVPGWPGCTSAISATDRVGRVRDRGPRHRPTDRPGDRIDPSSLNEEKLSRDNTRRRQAEYTERIELRRPRKCPAHLHRSSPQSSRGTECYQEPSFVPYVSVLGPWFSPCRRHTWPHIDVNLLPAINFNKSSAIAEMVAQCCTIRISLSRAGYINPLFLSNVWKCRHK